MATDGADPWDGNSAVSLSMDRSNGNGGSLDLKDLKPYRVRLSITYEYLVLAVTQADACSIKISQEAAKYEQPDTEHEDTWRIVAEETDLLTLPAHWDSDSNFYGTREDVSVREIREMLVGREAAGLEVGARVYDRRMDLFGRIEQILIGPAYSRRKDCPAKVKYEFPMSPDAEPREVRLGELVAAHKAERGVR